MRKVALVCAALAMTALTAPTVANAEVFSVRLDGGRDMYRDRGDYRTTRKFRGARAEYGYDWHDRGLHRGWYKNRGDTVIIKRRHRHWDD